MQVNVGDRVLPVAAFRGTTRPVLIVGTKGHIQRAIRAAEPFKYELRQRGVSLITLQTDELDSNSKLDALKKEFGRCAYFRAAKGLDARPLAGLKCFLSLLPIQASIFVCKTCPSYFLQHGANDPECLQRPYQACSPPR